MSTDAYREFTGKSVEEAIRAAREEFGVDLGELDFEILTSGSRGVLGMGAEPARIIAAPRSALGGSAPKREAAQAQPDTTTHTVANFTLANTMRRRPSFDMACVLTPWRMSFQERDGGGMEAGWLMGGGRRAGRCAPA